MKIEISRKSDDEALAFAESSRRSMAHLMAVAGHDLKQPLQVAMLSIEAAQGRAPAVGKRLAIARDALWRLGRELDDLARLSQQGEGLAVRRKAVDLQEIIARVERDWRDYADICDIQLQLKVPPVLVETDREMLGTILRNLVGNAIKFSGPGGRVGIGARLAMDRIILDVHDTGGGIPPEQFSRIFEAFYRGDQSQRTEGLGLGLLIVRHTAELLRHPISIRTIENEGSTFSIEVPLAASSHIPAPAFRFDRPAFDQAHA